MNKFTYRMEPGYIIVELKDGLGFRKLRIPDTVNINYDEATDTVKVVSTSGLESILNIKRKRKAKTVDEEFFLTAQEDSKDHIFSKDQISSKDLINLSSNNDYDSNIYNTNGLITDCKRKVNLNGAKLIFHGGKVVFKGKNTGIKIGPCVIFKVKKVCKRPKYKLVLIKKEVCVPRDDQCSSSNNCRECNSLKRGKKCKRCCEDTGIVWRKFIRKIRIIKPSYAAFKEDGALNTADIVNFMLYSNVEGFNDLDKDFTITTGGTLKYIGICPITVVISYSISGNIPDYTQADSAQVIVLAELDGSAIPASVTVSSVFDTFVEGFANSFPVSLVSGNIISFKAKLNPVAPSLLNPFAFPDPYFIEDGPNRIAANSINIYSI